MIVVNLNDYIDNKIFTVDPFVSIDDGEGLIEIAVEKGKNKIKRLSNLWRARRRSEEYSFLCRNCLNYVSCSPYRVPIARLAAAR